MSRFHWFLWVLVVCSNNHATISEEVDPDQDMEVFASPSAAKRYFRKCKKPEAPENGNLLCGLPKSGKPEIFCKTECSEGFAFPDGKTKKAATCPFRTGKWKPQKEFPDCIKSCPALELPYGTVSCQTEGKNYTCTAKCNERFEFANKVGSVSKLCNPETLKWMPDDKFPLCVQMCMSLASPKHGTISCQSNSDSNTCKAECEKTYKFPSGSTKLERVCHFSTGAWTPEETIPDCVSRCETPATPVDGSVNCKVDNKTNNYVCVASCLPGFRFISGETTLNHSCNLNTGTWDSAVEFPNCTDPCADMGELKNGSLSCTIEDEKKICKATCQDDLLFPNGDSVGSASCDLEKGEWIKKLEFDTCLKPCQGSAYLKKPQYGNYSCDINGTKATCNALCDVGFQFPENSITTISCDTKTGKWSSKFAFPDCAVKCKIPEKPANSDLTCMRSSEEKTKYLCDVVCHKGHQFPNGKQKTEHYCDLNTLEWSPRAHFLDCIPLCKSPSNPLNGVINCYSSPEDGNSYKCDATCLSGFEFPDGSKKIAHLCNWETGEWSPKMEFPDCVGGCDPKCQNNGVCVGNNTCICEKQFRGDRCQHDRDVCKPSKHFPGSASFDCDDVDDGYSCTIKCSDGTKFSYTPSDSYHCLFNGTWAPDKAPTCESIDVIPSPVSPSDLKPQHIKPPKEAICATWNHRHYSTFDGNMYNFKGACTYLLVKDCFDGTFAIHMDQQNQTLIIYIGKSSYTMSMNLDVTSIKHNGTVYFAPVWIDGLSFKTVAHYTRVISDSLGFSLKWDGRSTVLLKAESTLFNKTCGLCGNFDTIKGNDWTKADGNTAFDVEDFANSWKIETLLKTCSVPIDKHHPCSSGDTMEKATKVCKIIKDSRFQSCHKIVEVEKYYEACIMDFCDRKSVADEDYVCNSLSQYFRECTRLGQRLEGGWRNETVCPLSCKNGMVYNDCGSACPRTCDNHIYSCEADHCIDGCHCPTGTVMLDGKCVAQVDCPCEKDGKIYKKGEKLQRECKTCICVGGKFQCTKDNCMATCSLSGGSHYVTFDGYRYDHITTCPVYLIYNDNFTIVQEKTECLGKSGHESYCIKEIQINMENSTLVLKSDPAPIFNDRQVPDHPFTENGISVYKATSSFIKVELPNSLSILWDGKNQVYIDAPLSLLDKTKGLCGTYNRNQMDDFITPNGDVEADITTFATRWQYYDTCFNRVHGTGQTECDQAQNAQESEEFCSFLKGDTFAPCHDEVDPEVHYQECMADVCSCQGKLFECICPIIKHYSFLCARKGIILDWMEKISQCKLKCSAGKIYQPCSNPCKSSCRAIAEAKYCVKSCVPGCTCPEGQTLDDEGNCLPIDQCPCVVDGREYSAQTSCIQGENICECSSAVLTCRPASPDELSSSTISRGFNCTANEESTTCVEDCPETCQNMLLQHRCHTKVCKSGCKCKEGYVLDMGKCVKRSECGCRHGGKKYDNGYTMKFDCNLCTCTENKWKCTKKICPGRCTVWGASHFKTFDGHIYDFNGNCEFRLSMGELSDGTTFSINMLNTPCGTSGVTCSKTFTLDIHTNKTGAKRVVLSDSIPLPREQYNPPFVYDNGLYVFVFTDIGLSLQWDKGTRLYVILESTWRSRVSGLCGNYDDDWTNDFQTPSGGLPEARPTMFANSWKLRESCPKPNLLEDACSSHPFRRTWARKKCSVLHTPLFEQCHSEVNVKPYYDKCVFDTCTCDEGGDCECLCTALAAYAQECSINGVHIKWRSQELCPIQCESCAKYDSCRSICPKETCENQIFFQNVESYCASDICIEGCNPDPCPAGQVYNNSRDYICIPRAECRIPCREYDGKLYYEGERVKSGHISECQTCHCILGEISCKGIPCTSGGVVKCREHGWTPWINITSPSSLDKTYKLFHGLASSLWLKAYCGLRDVKNMECKLNGVLVDCPLRGSLCSSDDQGTSCKTYSVRIYCNCIKPTVPPTTTQPPLIETTLAVKTTVPPTTTQPPLIETTLAALCPDGEVYKKCAYRCNQTCDSFRQDLISNRGVCKNSDINECIEGCGPEEACESSTFWRDYKTCVKKEECPCSITTEGNVTILTPNDVVTRDCETCQCVSNQLQCVQIPDCPEETTTFIQSTLSYFISTVMTPTTTPAPALTTSIETSECWTEWINNSTVGVGGDFEDLNSARGKYKFCSNPVKIECRTVKDKIPSEEAEQDVTCNLEKGLKCFDDDNLPDGCLDYEIRIFCPCEITTPPTTTTTTTTIAPSAPCVNGWTSWYSSHLPDEFGESETIQSVRGHGAYFCSSDMIGGIECRKKGNEGSSTLQDNVICDLQHGLQCLNSNLEKDETCDDYEVRFFCDCPTSSPSPTTIASTVTTEPVTTTELPTRVPCAQWSDWINDYHPHGKEGYTKHRGKGKHGRHNVRTGDKERKTLYQLRHTQKFCLEGQLSQIECQTADTGVDYLQANDVNLTCSLTEGFQCDGKNQRSGRCQDYKIRYFCDCGEEIPTTTVVVQPTTPTPGIKKCSSFYYLVNGPHALPDSSFHASTALRKHSTGPQKARLIYGKYGGGWVPKRNTKTEFLEVDLGAVKPVYGVVTKGSVKKWVTSYHVLYSRNAEGPFQYVQDSDQNNVIFTGNFDSNTRNVHVFEQPFVARYIRIQPRTWEHDIGLRVDFLGCALGTSYTIVIRWVNIRYICADKMGLQNGKLHDGQITFSSVKDINSGASSVRLNTKQINGRGGAWVAETSDSKQYVQIDFLGPRNLTGVITQGQDRGNQWVQAYEIHYSQDNYEWQSILDTDGETLVFAGNFDHDTAVTNYFPAMIEARYLRLVPKSWKHGIALRLEVLGCYRPYFFFAPTVPEPYEITTTETTSEEMPTTPVVIQPTTSPPSIRPCSSFYYLVNGPLPLPDSSFKASSTLKDHTDAQKARLVYGDKHGEGWVPHESTKAQFLEVDLGAIKPVYGVVTKGSVNKWVTSYHVLYSRNPEGPFSYIQDSDKNNVIFTGNFDNDTRNYHIFEKPFEARYVRIQPLTWEQHIGLRVDYLGCALGTSYKIMITYINIRRICADRMGLQNGQLHDGQITFSSVETLHTGASSVRLNSKRVNGFGGAWVPKTSDSNQYVQIDFLGPRNLTGVITRGRDHVHEWVQAYEIHYSLDNYEWHSILNSDGKTKIFAGNFDSFVPVTNYFPTTIQARYLRLVPKLWESKIALRMEVIGCFQPYFFVPATTPYEISTEETTVTIEPTTTTELPTLVPCAHWSDWINEHHPRSQTAFSKHRGKGGKSHRTVVGDKEKKTLLQLRQTQNFCLEGQLSKIECGTADVSEAKDVNITCSLTEGFHCEGKDQPSGYCRDYKIRYFCDCGEEMPTTPVVIQPTTSPPSIRPCSSFYYLVNGPLPVPDSSFKASSTLKEEHTGAQKARLVYGEKHGEGWVPRLSTKAQFLEVDLGAVKPVYGVVTKGTVKKWVTSYHVLYSRNPEGPFSYVQDSEKKNIIFTGNFDSDTRNVHVFEKPFEARYVRIQPLTWEHHIGLRVDFLGCALGTSYKIVITYIRTRYICADKMGLQNRQLHDSQITFSSVKDSRAGPSSVRLNVKQIHGHGGGWVPDTLDKNQYVQIDFLGPRNLTGIITQGRDRVYQWVQAYEIRYSQDNHIWHSILNRDGKTKIFAGNFDYNTAVTNYFPTVIRARYLRLVPKLWRHRIALRLEVLGCFQPYFVGPTTPAPVEITTTEVPSDCVIYGRWLSLHDSTHVQDDYEPISEIIGATKLCLNPVEIQCRDVMTHVSSTKTKNVKCNLQQGLVCKSSAGKKCSNYEVRIGCWKCGGPEKMIMVPACPEMPSSMLYKCPESCPKDYACDGSKCVPYAKCPCYREKIFYPSEIQQTSDCLMCDCMVGGHTRCKPITCDQIKCEVDEILVKDKKCRCHCEKCPPGKRLCPTTSKCIEEAKWCDGVVDCEDDEIRCPILLPTTPATPAPSTVTTTTVETPTTTVEIPTTTVEIPTTTGKPAVCEWSATAETDSCTLSSHIIQTFDRQWYIYETCRHILVKEKTHENFAVTVHSTCSDVLRLPCEHYVVINVGDILVQLGPGMNTVHVNGTEILVKNVGLISKRHKNLFNLKKRGTEIVFKSYKYHFEVSWNVASDITVKVLRCRSYQLAGLCGNYNNVSDDDMQKPNGEMATGTEDFGNSWSIGVHEPCPQSNCSAKVRAQAVTVCKELSKSPFDSCSSYMTMSDDAHLEACLSHMCDCLQNSSSSDQLDICRCQVYETFVEKCESEKGSTVQGWRMKYDCASKCENGMEWMECGPGCELTCDNYRERNEVCEEKACVPGCYCPEGLVNHENKCVSPKLCLDCVCNGQGDPNYISFDFNYYAFQGNCTYVLARHRSGDAIKDFEIWGTNVECPKYPHATCVKEVKLMWNKQFVRKTQNGPVYFNHVPIPDNVTHFEKNGIEVFNWQDRKTTKIIIEAINLILTYYDSLPSYEIGLPSYFYYNKTEGLCGNCNSDDSDDMYHSGGYITEDVDDFAYSWLVNGSRDECTLPTGTKNPPPYDCNFTVPSCNMIIDPSLHVRSCENDAAYSVNATTCAAKYMYAQQCCQRGVSLADWIIQSNCSECQAGMHLECITGCQKTCDNDKSNKLSSCDSNPHYECVCPEGKVLKAGKCIDPALCETCDDQHAVNDTWFTDVCTKCVCDKDLHIQCVNTQCPPPPICLEGETVLTKEPQPGTCCKEHQCVPVQKGCETPSIVTCHPGESLVRILENGCSMLKCECVKENCPPASKPYIEQVGEKWELKQVGCCDKYVSTCIPASECPPPPDCPTVGFALSTHKGKCCNESMCVPKNDACIYKHEYKVVNGTQISLDVKDYYKAEYKPGTTWNDGLCTKCACSKINGIFTYNCQIKRCGEPHQYPDYNKYEWKTDHAPGACCPKYTRVKCKVGNKAYSAGETWPSYKGDKCKNYLCLQLQDGEVVVQESTTICRVNCAAYEKYVPPKLESPNCCGRCERIACEENEAIYQVGETWIPTLNPCLIAQCISTERGLIVRYKDKVCPDLPKDCSPEQIVYDAHGCCPHCNVETDLCVASRIPLKNTVAYFNLTDASEGVCANPVPIANLTKCTGQCEGISLYSNVGDFENICRCCLPISTVKRSVQLLCKTGKTITKIYQQPTACRCMSCH